ncbi:MAG: S41 family peptidase [Anaerolineales bacterium]
MKPRSETLSAILILAVAAACGPRSVSPTSAVAGDFPAAEIQNDEGGPVTVTGEVVYTYPFFTSGIAEPIIVLEDQGGFVTRDRNFIFPSESQVLGQITSDFYTSPFSYSLNLPEDPQGTLRDVDGDGASDPGVMVFAVAYWTNVWGDPYLEKRDQAGGGWSTAYASTRISDNPSDRGEVVGGIYLVFAPEAGQGFPSGFGDDRELFTADDPIVGLPQGWTRVDLDTTPFTFDRAREPAIPLVEPAGLALDDFSQLGYAEAFDAMLQKFRNEYAFTELKDMDWDTLGDEFRPRFAAAESSADSRAYLLALRDFLWSIPDGHVGMDLSPLNDLFQTETAGGIGLAIRQLDDGRVIASLVVVGGPAEDAGVQLGTQILSLNGVSIGESVRTTVPWSSPFSTEHSLRLQQLRYAMRFPVGTEVELTFRDQAGETVTAALTAVPETESFTATSFYAGVTGLELPVEFHQLDNGFGYARVMSFFDNDLLTIQLWERMIQDLNNYEMPGLILDLRQNGGGSGYLADQMAAYFFDEETVTGNTAIYDDSTGDFFLDPTDPGLMYPPREDLRYHGPVVVIVGPACASACEFFSYDMTLNARATVVGQYPSAGLGGSVEDFAMPEGMSIRMTIGRAVDAEGQIHIEGIGVVPDIRVPVTEATVLNGGRDVILDAAAQAIGTPTGAGVVPEGPPAMASLAASNSALGQALQGGGPPTLDSLARESYGQSFDAGDFTYTVVLGASRDALWSWAWCTADQASFDDNWAVIEVAFTLDGAPVAADELAQRDDTLPGGVCRQIGTVLSSWPVGDHVLEIDVNFKEAMNDGFADYDPGIRHLEFHVIVDR